MGSAFDPRDIKVREQPAWVTLTGGIPLPASSTPRVEEVLRDNVQFDIESLLLRDPEGFVSGQIHRCWPEWKIILKNNMSSSEVSNWIQNGVDIHDFFQEFKGNFKGRHFNSRLPPKQYFVNSATCKQHVQFINRELNEKIASGAIRLLGKVGSCQPPRVVMPLVVEPSKPRLCHDERFLNLWIKDSPFRLETLKDVHRLVQKDSQMVTCDEKSGYCHVKLSEESQTYFGIQFGGFFMTYATLPFGWKASPYIYQTIGMSVTSYLREFSIENVLYIDDRLVVSSGSESAHLEARKLAYGMLELLTRLGYTLAVRKCSLEPSTQKKFLGFIIDSVRQAYILPDDKRARFIELRELMLSQEELDVKTLQRFCGKCVSMSLAVPGCKLFCREVNTAISRALRNSRNVSVSGALKEELEYWRFLDEWSGCSKWRPEFHRMINMYTDSSGFRYGASLGLGKEDMVIGDYWEKDDSRPIHEKEADAVLKSLQSLASVVQDSRVDVLTDNMAVIGAWESQGGRCGPLNRIMKDIFGFVVRFNVDLHMTFVPSKLNIADAPSRVKSAGDTMLSQESWSLVELRYGPHTVDLMSLDSNVMKTKDGRPLRHFTPWPTPLSSGVNVFGQNVREEVNPYVFPPFGLILPILCLLEEQKVSCTVVVPKIQPLPLWWPKLETHSTGSFCLGEKGQKGVVYVPTRKGFVHDGVGLRWALFAFRVSFS